MNAALSIINPGAIIGPSIISGIRQSNEQVFITPATKGLVNVKDMLGKKDFPVSYVSPEFEKDFSCLFENISGKEAECGWHCQIEPLDGKKALPVRQVCNSLPVTAVLSLLQAKVLSKDGTVYVTPVSCAAGQYRLLSIRWAGKGWVFRSYPIDFPRVLRKTRKFISRADIIS